MAEYLQEKEHADHIVQMDVHVQDEIGDTQLSYELMEDVGADGRWETINTLPRIFVDFRREFTGVSEDWIYCMGFPAVTAIKVQSSYGGGSVSVDVSMGVKDAGDYRIVAALVETALWVIRKVTVKTVRGIPITMCYAAFLPEAFSAVKT